MILIPDLVLFLAVLIGTEGNDGTTEELCKGSLRIPEGRMFLDVDNVKSYTVKGSLVRFNLIKAKLVKGIRYASVCGMSKDQWVKNLQNYVDDKAKVIQPKSTTKTTTATATPEKSATRKVPEKSYKPSLIPTKEMKTEKNSEIQKQTTTQTVTEAGSIKSTTVKEETQSQRLLVTRPIIATPGTIPDQSIENEENIINAAGMRPTTYTLTMLTTKAEDASVIPGKREGSGASDTEEPLKIKTDKQTTIAIISRLGISLVFAGIVTYLLFKRRRGHRLKKKASDLTVTSVFPEKDAHFELDDVSNMSCPEDDERSKMI
ncbi:uncharacterized protein LOC122806348 [Protopterus annectens]|uniref:uncharacterized protein LOC122806348 n=1 Tax=Protopterus annectens TaxID=7888 RepID=UPI001CFC2523|nr:uncharacterized protein LOC122806348 [Protopterus annectens]